MWTLGGYRIIVNGDTRKPEPKISEHFVLDGTQSIFHYFGYGSPTRTLTGTMLDNPDDLSPLEALCNTATPSALISDQGAEGDYLIMSIVSQRVMDIKRTKPVWRFTIELKQA